MLKLNVVTRVKPDQWLLLREPVRKWVIRGHSPDVGWDQGWHESWKRMISSRLTN